MELFACSGPGAGALIARNVEISYAHAAIATGLLLVSLALFAIGVRRWAAPAVLLCLLVLHPAWTMAGMEADCGHQQRNVSWLFTCLGTMAICWQVGHWLWARRRTTVGVSAEF